MWHSGHYEEMANRYREYLSLKDWAPNHELLQWAQGESARIRDGSISKVRFDLLKSKGIATPKGLVRRAIDAGYTKLDSDEKLADFKQRAEDYARTLSVKNGTRPQRLWRESQEKQVAAKTLSQRRATILQSVGLLDVYRCKDELTR